MDEFEKQLGDLRQLSPPTTPALPPDVLRDRARKAKRRSQLTLAVPSAFLVLVLVAGVVIVKNRDADTTGQQVTTASTVPSEVLGLSPRDLQMIDYLDNVGTLRVALMHEMLDTASFASTNKTAQADALLTDRKATDDAMAAWTAKRDEVKAGRDDTQLTEALKTADTRFKELSTIRKSVDALQTDPKNLVDDYNLAISDLTRIDRVVVLSTQTPTAFRLLWTYFAAVSLTDTKAELAALVTIPVEIRFYAGVLPTGSQPVARRNNDAGQGCGDDAAGSAGACKIYLDIVNADTELTNLTADSDPTGEQRRTNPNGLKFDEFTRHAIEDGQGHNDLSGAGGTSNIDPAEWRAAAHDAVNRFAAAERQTLHNPPATSSNAQAVPADRAVELLRTITGLRQAYMHEMLASASFASTNKAAPVDLAGDRNATDTAVADYTATADKLDLGHQNDTIAAALKAADTRLKTLPTIRKVVDSIQADPSKIVDDYKLSLTDFTAVETTVVNASDVPTPFRTLWAHRSLAAVTDAEASTAAFLTVAVEIGFYPTVLPTGSQPVPQRLDELHKGCGNDAAAAGNDCKFYVESISANDAVTRAEIDFENVATGEQKQMKRFADAGNNYDEFKRYSFENGQGHNDLTGGSLGSTAISPTDWRAAAGERVDKLIAAEHAILDSI